ncbi:o-succinylbenzoate--CoA ligase [Lysinibacillus sp. 54212]|uniref:o-succinylbenzoate--CoA ligase n=1 Tax=Lysinibacillus sp. 54212 TaxID=3119829 RepID=UPI002FCA8165
MQPNWIMQRSLLTPNRVGLSFQQKQWTFKELYENSLKTARQLASHSLFEGDRVAILAPSTPQLIFMLYGCMQARIEIVLLNGRLSEQELRYQVDDAEVKAIIVHEKERRKLSDERIIFFEEIMNAPQQSISISNEWDELSTVSIMYTSGTTGFPKGVRQTVQNHSASAVSSALNLGLSEEDSWLCCVPIFHISGFSILVRSLLYGMTVRLYENFDVEACTHEIVEGTVTKMSVVAVTLQRILTEMEARNLKAHPRFSTMLVGGGPVPVDYLKRAAKLSLNVAQTYGMTETSSQTATLSNEDALRKIGSAGKPLFFNRIKIDNGTSCHTEGEILIRGPHVTPGYIGRFRDKSSTVDGWLKTGDIGYIDEEGYLYVIDRRSDLIISGGENIYPAEIENVLMAHPSIKEAGVCGIEDESWGQVPAAFIVRKEAITEPEIMSYCRNQLASYKLPKRIKFVDELPRNASNKLLRRKLKEMQ